MNEHQSQAESSTDEPLAELDGEPPEPSFEVQIANQQSSLEIDESQLEAAAQAIIRDSDYHAGTVSIAVVDDPTIHEINRQYLEHDYPTDVLSFVLEDHPPYLEGELVVSTDTAISNAFDYEWPAASELLLYVVHGTLHLVGYRDKDADDILAMRQAEDKYLNQLGIERPEKYQRLANEAAQTPPTGEVPPQ